MVRSSTWQRTSSGVTLALAFPGGSWGVTSDVGAPALPGVWTHVAVVYDGGQQRLYINGVRAATIEASRSLIEALAGADIGQPLGDGLVEGADLHGGRREPARRVVAVVVFAVVDRRLARADHLGLVENQKLITTRHRQFSQSANDFDHQAGLFQAFARASLTRTFALVDEASGQGKLACTGRHLALDENDATIHGDEQHRDALGIVVVGELLAAMAVGEGRTLLHDFTKSRAAERAKFVV